MTQTTHESMLASCTLNISNALRTITEMADNSTRTRTLRMDAVRAQMVKLSVEAKIDERRERSRSASKTFGCRRLHVFSLATEPSDQINSRLSESRAPSRNSSRESRGGTCIRARLSPHVEFVEWEHQRAEEEEEGLERSRGSRGSS